MSIQKFKTGFFKIGPTLHGPRLVCTNAGVLCQLTLNHCSQTLGTPAYVPYHTRLDMSEVCISIDPRVLKDPGLRCICGCTCKYMSKSCKLNMHVNIIDIYI